MPTHDQMPTQDQVVQAAICVFDYVLNPAVRGELNRVLAAAKASPDDGEKVLQDFFDHRAYATTPDAFKRVFSDYAKNPITLSPKATRFAIDFAANPVLRLDWYDAARQMAAAQRATNSAAALASAQPDPLAPFNDVLKRNGYGDVTADQATLAQTRLLTSGIGAWTGIYSKTTIFNEKVDGKDGPTLTIDTSEDPPQVRLDKRHILDYKFDPDTNTLSWTKEGGGDLSQNGTAATLYFSRDDAPSFTGTLENSDGKFSYFGSVDRGGSSGGGEGGTSGDGGGGSKLSQSDLIAIISGTVSAAIGIAAVVAGAVGAHYARVGFHAIAEEEKTVATRLEQVDGHVTTLTKIEKKSPITTRAFINMTGDKEVGAAIVIKEESQGQPNKQVEDKLYSELSAEVGDISSIENQEINNQTRETVLNTEQIVTDVRT